MLRFDRDFFQSFELSEIESISLSGGKMMTFVSFSENLNGNNFSSLVFRLHATLLICNMFLNIVDFLVSY